MKVQTELKAGDIQAYEGLIHRLAHFLIAKLPANIEMDDLLQEGRIAVWEALPRFDPNLGSLETFLTRRIQGAFLDHLRQGDVLTRGERRQVRRLEKAMNGFEYVDRGILARQLKLSLEELEELLLLRELQHVASGDIPQNNEEGPTLFDLVAAKDNNPTDVIRFKECLASIERVINKSYASNAEIAREVFQRHFLDEQDLKDIGDFLGVTESRVCQIANQIRQMVEYQLRY